MTPRSGLTSRLPCWAAGWRCFAALCCCSVTATLVGKLGCVGTVLLHCLVALALFCYAVLLAWSPSVLQGVREKKGRRGPAPPPAPWDPGDLLKDTGVLLKDPGVL